MNLEEFETMWTTSVANYVLVRSETRPGTYAIYNRVNQVLELIDDDDAHQAVVQKMLNAGVPVLDRPPDE